MVPDGNTKGRMNIPHSEYHVSPLLHLLDTIKPPVWIIHSGRESILHIKSNLFQSLDEQQVKDGTLVLLPEAHKHDSLSLSDLCTCHT